MKTTIVLKKEITKNLPNAYNQKPVAFVGYKLVIEVAESYNIDSEIFVFQRDVTSKYIERGVLDTFYSIASVAEIGFLPVGAPDVNGTNFFRESKIELVFETINEAEDAWKKISFEVNELSIANDYTLDLTPEEYISYPNASMRKLYGMSVNTLLTSDALLDTLVSDCIPSTDIVYTEGHYVDKYAYCVIYHRYGTLFDMFINDVKIDTTIQGQITITGCNEQPQLCNIFRSTSPVVATLQTVQLSFYRHIEE